MITCFVWSTTKKNPDANKIKKKDKGTFTESTGGAEYEHWTITIDMNDGKVISKSKRDWKWHISNMWCWWTA